MCPPTLGCQPMGSAQLTSKFPDQESQEQFIESTRTLLTSHKAVRATLDPPVSRQRPPNFSGTPHAFCQANPSDSLPMRLRFPIRNLLATCAIAASLASQCGLPAAESDQPKIDSEIKLTDVDLSRDPKESAGTVRFHVAAPVGIRFYVSYTIRGVRGAANTNHVWQISSDNGADVEIKFDYPMNFAGDRTIAALDSQQDQLEYRENVKGCIGSGLVTIVSAPLFTTPKDERSIKILKSDAERAAVTASGARRVLLVTRKADADEDPDTTEPRTELIVGIQPRPLPALPLVGRSAAPPPQPAPVDPIRTAHVKYRRVSLGSSDLKPLSPDEVSQIVAAADLDNKPDAASDVAAQLCSRESFPKKLPGQEFISDGAKTRENSDFAVRIFDGDWDVNYMPQPAWRQIDVWRAGKSQLFRMTLSRFRIDVPRPAVAEARRSPGQGLDIDPKTGFVRHVSHGNRQTGGFDDRRQFAPKTYDSEQVFPLVSIVTRFQDGKLASLEMTLIDEAQFNQPVDPEEFVPSAKAADHVVIHGPDRVQPPRQAIPKQDVKDLLAYLRASNLLNVDPVAELIEQDGPQLYTGSDFIILGSSEGLSDKLGREIAKIEGVQDVAPALIDAVVLSQTSATGQQPDGPSAVFLFGCPLDSPTISALNIQSGGRPLNADDKKKAIIGRDLAKRLDKKEGDEITLYDSERFQIVGIYFSRKPLENRSLIVPLTEMQRLMNRPGQVNMISITAQRPIDDKGLETLRQRLKSAHPRLDVSFVQP
jgi:MacB-like periplasmic core domain